MDKLEKYNKEQINIVVDLGTKEKLKKISSIKSLEEGVYVSYVDLIKRYIDDLINTSGSLQVILTKGVSSGQKD